jgi:hypothetical protein
VTLLSRYRFCQHKTASPLLARRRKTPSHIYRPGRWSHLSLPLPLRRQEGWGTLFLHSLVSVSDCLLWCIVGVVRVATRANKLDSTPLPHRQRPSQRRLIVDGNVCLSIQIGSLVFLLFITFGEICFLACHWHSPLSMEPGRGGCSRARRLLQRCGSVVIPRLRR